MFDFFFSVAVGCLAFVCRSVAVIAATVAVESTLISSRHDESAALLNVRTVFSWSSFARAMNHFCLLSELSRFGEWS